MVVNVAYLREVHIDQASGHDRVLAGLADRATVRVLEPCLPRALPGWAARRLAPPFGEHPRLSFYEPSALKVEYGAVRRLLTAPDEVVHVLQGDSHCNYAAWARFVPRRGAYVTTFHNPPEKFEEIYRHRRKRARFEVIDGLTVLSREMEAYFKPLLGDLVRFVPYGVNRQAFGPPAAPRPVRDEVRVLSVGGWLRDPALLRATIERVARESDRVSFTVLSTPAYLAQLGDVPRTTTGTGVFGADLVRTYHEHDVFVHPARMSSGSTAMLEAMATGLPVAVPAVGGVPDYADASCAELTTPDDPDALAEAVLRLAADPERRARLGAAAEQRTRTLDWPYIAHEYVETYRQALARRGRPVA